MSHLGVMEIFFGDPWPADARLNYAGYLKSEGYGFYLYAPKADRHLRKEWSKPWEPEYVRELTEMARTFQSQGVKYGIALSPFEIDQMTTAQIDQLLDEKIGIFNKIGLDYLGIFFDDMMVYDGLAAHQITLLNKVRERTSAKILFCPTFYSYDPILDKVFGQRPPDYLEQIADGIATDVEILWTGPKVLSDEISPAHIDEVTRLLKRPPFLCDNVFANDGPKNCKFLKLKYPAGRPAESFKKANGWAINPMNQSEISKIVLSAMNKAARGAAPQNAFESAVRQICSEPLSQLVIKNRELFLTEGIDKIPEPVKSSLLADLEKMNEPVALEIKDWLLGKYTVGTECLTD